MTKRNPIIGDLVEEYRLVVRPSRGRVRATLWFARQLASLVRPWMWGCAFGAALGIENIIETAYRPLAEDSPAFLLGFAASALTVWAAIGVCAARQRSRWLDGVAASFAASTATMLVSQVANFARVLTFYDRLQYNGEWASLMARFHASGMTDLRAFVFLDYARNTPMFVAMMVAAGTLSGAIASAIVLRRPWLSRLDYT